MLVRHGVHVLLPIVVNLSMRDIGRLVAFNNIESYAPKMYVN